MTLQELVTVLVTLFSSLPCEIFLIVMLNVGAAGHLEAPRCVEPRRVRMLLPMTQEPTLPRLCRRNLGNVEVSDQAFKQDAKLGVACDS